jgi:hypothetical protein
MVLNIYTNKKSNQALGPLHRDWATINGHLASAGDEPLGGDKTHDSDEKLC